MEVFHASTVQIDTPDIYHSRQYLDFGPGFYVTTMYDRQKSMPIDLFVEEKLPL